MHKAPCESVVLWYESTIILGDKAMRFHWKLLESKYSSNTPLKMKHASKFTASGQHIAFWSVEAAAVTRRTATREGPYGREFGSTILAVNTLPQKKLTSTRA